MRILFRAWLGFQGLLLVFIVTTHGKGMEPDLRLLSGAAMTLASFPLSLLALYASLTSLDLLAVQDNIIKGLANWSGCFAAGTIQFWLLGKLVNRLQVAKSKQE